MQKVTNCGKCVFSPFFEEEAIQQSCHSYVLRRKGIRKNGGVREEVTIIHRDAPHLKKGEKQRIIIISHPGPQRTDLSKAFS